MRSVAEVQAEKKKPASSTPFLKDEVRDLLKADQGFSYVPDRRQNHDFGKISVFSDNRLLAGQPKVQQQSVPGQPEVKPETEGSTVEDKLAFLPNAADENAVAAPSAGNNSQAPAMKLIRKEQSVFSAPGMESTKPPVLSQEWVNMDPGAWLSEHVSAYRLLKIFLLLYNNASSGWEELSSPRISPTNRRTRTYIRWVQGLYPAP